MGSIFLALLAPLAPKPSIHLMHFKYSRMDDTSHMFLISTDMVYQSILVNGSDI